MTKTKKKSAYAQAGVDIDEMMQGLDAIKKMVKGTDTPGVLSSIGSFGGLFHAHGSTQNNHIGQGHFLAAPQGFIEVQLNLGKGLQGLGQFFRIIGRPCHLRLQAKACAVGATAHV